MKIKVHFDCYNCARKRTVEIFVPDRFMTKHFNIGCDICRRFMSAFLPAIPYSQISKHENGVSVKYMRA